MVRLVFVLGAQNDASGNLSDVSLSRISRAIHEQRLIPNTVLLATGGYGAHFNLTGTAHREFLYRKMEAEGATVDRARPDDLLSSNTVEDILMIAAFAAQRGSRRFDVLTSDFHAPRCRFILKCLAADYDVAVLTARDPAGINQALLDHEIRALELLNQQGGVFVDGVLHPF